MASCCGQGDGFSTSPVISMASPREVLMYVSCVQSPNNSGKSDYLATIDVDPTSPTFCQVLNRLYMPEVGDELHHFGWNACVSCPDRDAAHRYLVVPGFFSGNIHIIDATSNPKEPSIHKVIKGAEITQKYNATFPHTVHCIPTGDIMIHTLGDMNGDAKGSFFLLDGKTFEPKGLWNQGNENIKGHDYWYQPRHNIMISTEFGAPNKFSKGFDPKDLAAGFYGTKIHLWHWNERKLFDTIDLGLGGAIPMEIRFLHNPDATDAYIVTAVGGSVYHVTQNFLKSWTANKVIDIPVKKVSNWQLPEMPALITDAVISLDDKYLFISCYLHGDVRQYDITNRLSPQLVSQVFLGGSIVDDMGVKVEKDDELSAQPARPVVKGRPIHGAPHMVQLSRDGKRLYVTTSIITPWDNQFYGPDLVQRGGVMVMLDVTSEGMKINQDFLVDFGTEPDGPCRGHEMRFPGGDCTSDIWV